MELKTLDISFCDKNALNLVNKEAKELIINNKLKSYDIGMSHKYANIINPRSIRFLSLQPHLITIKTVGANYFLFLTRINELNMCLFIDRKIKKGYTFPRIISTKFSFDDELFTDTLIDGEIVKDDKGNWMFLIGDLILHKGKRETGNIITKYNKLYKILGEHYTPDPILDICPLRIKKLFKYSDYGRLITQFIPSLTYKIRGLYFNTLNTSHCNHLFMYNEETKKVRNVTTRTKKPETEIQISNAPKNKDADNIFVIRKTEKPDIYELFQNDDNKGVAHIGKLQISKKIKKYFETKEESQNIKMLCKFNEGFKKWEPVSLHEIV